MVSIITMLLTFMAPMMTQPEQTVTLPNSLTQTISLETTIWSGVHVVLTTCIKSAQDCTDLTMHGQDA